MSRFLLICPGGALGSAGAGFPPGTLSPNATLEKVRVLKHGAGRKR